MEVWVFFLQAEDGIRVLVRSRGLGDVYKRQAIFDVGLNFENRTLREPPPSTAQKFTASNALFSYCLLYTSDAADERSSVDLGGRRIIKKKNYRRNRSCRVLRENITAS